MGPWQIWTWEFEFGKHPAVILSNSEVVHLKDRVVVVSCSTQQASRGAKRFEVILDQSDGLEWPTLCRCDLLYTVPKRELVKRRGVVTLVRRREIAERVIRSLAFVNL